MVISMMENIIKLIESGNVSFPRLLLLNYKNLKLSSDELLLIIYLLNDSDIFNPKKISDEMSLTIPEVLEKVSFLE